MASLAFSQMQAMNKKNALDHDRDATTIHRLQLAALNARRKILEMGYTNHIRLHYGALMSMVEIMITLYLRWLQADPQNPDWAERDRFVLSKGRCGCGGSLTNLILSVSGDCIPSCKGTRIATKPRGWIAAPDRSGRVSR